MLNMFLLLSVVAICLMLVVILAMAAGAVFFKRKPIQHCGGSSIVYKGEQIDCPVCQGCDKVCNQAVIPNRHDAS